MKQLLTLSLVTLIVFPSFLGATDSLTYSFNRSEIREYIPICTNNLTADKLYARIVESDTEIAYEFLFYWESQSGYYRFASHDYDWEFIVTHERCLVGSISLHLSFNKCTWQTSRLFSRYYLYEMIKRNFVEMIE